MKKIVINNLSGHGLPKGKSYVIAVTLDFEDMDASELANCMLNASSPKVKVNTRLGTWTIARLDALNGKYEVKVRDLYTRQERAYRPPTKEEALDTLANLPRDEYIDFMVDNGLSEEMAIASYNRKHGIKE